IVPTFARSASSSTGRLIAPGRWSSAYSAGARTSMMSSKPWAARSVRDVRVMAMRLDSGGWLRRKGRLCGWGLRVGSAETVEQLLHRIAVVFRCGGGCGFGCRIGGQPRGFDGGLVAGGGPRGCCAKRDRIHESGPVACGKGCRPIGNAAQKVVQPVLVGLGEIMQHISGHGVFMPRMANAKAHATISLTNMTVNRAQAIMPRMAAALFHPRLAGGEVQLFMQDGDIGGGEVVETRSLGHRLPRQVHEGFGLQQDDLFITQTALAGQSLKSALPRTKAVVGGDAVQRHEADVVAVGRIFRAGIAQAHKEFHCRPRLSDLAE